VESSVWNFVRKYIKKVSVNSAVNNFYAAVNNHEHGEAFKIDVISDKLNVVGMCIS
jgi:hypothetical protein